MCEQCCAGGFTFEFKECGRAAFGYAVGAEQCHRQHLRAAASVADGDALAIELRKQSDRLRCAIKDHQRLAEHSSEERRVGQSVSVRVDLGGRRIIKKKNVE